MKLTLKPLEWGVFANEFALLSSYGMIVGGVVAVVNMFSKLEIGVYSFITGMIVFSLDYPRSYREDSKFVARRYQEYLVPYVVALGTFGENFYIRSVLYLIFSVPCFFLLPTFIGGSCIITASMIYFIAATHGFKWKPMPFKLEKCPAVNNISDVDFLSMKETSC